MRTRTLCVALCLLFCLAGSFSANVEMAGASEQQLFPWASFDPSIPTQKEVLGFHPGARPLTHGEAMHFLKALADASPLAEMRSYAKTHEGRELVTFFVSEAQTISSLDRFQDEHVRRVDPRGRAAATDKQLLKEAKAVAWIAYGIHGDELSSVDAACAVAYWLVAGTDERAQRLRRELLIIIDPVENPDGRDRYLAQTRAFAHKLPNVDQDDLSHSAIWPWGRGNHYLFDLNRDWFSMVHPESKRSGVIASWEPQLMVDSHEMGANDSYLFAPPRHPFNPHLPESHRKWWDRFATDQAQALDERGFPYYTREWNEEFFPGFGSSWAAYRGALGILYEMSRTTGKLVRKHSGELRTYAEAVEHHALSSISNLDSLAKNRVEFLNDYVEDRRRFIGSIGKAGPAAWILPEGEKPGRTRALVKLLRQQGIEVWGRSDGATKLTGLRDARSGEAVAAAAVGSNAWMVPLDQPGGRMVRELLDPHLPMQAPYFREERKSIERGDGSRLYETTSWSLPFNYAVDAYWTKTKPEAGWDRDKPVAAAAGRVEGETTVAWLLEGSSDASVSALADLLQRGLNVRVARRPFAVDGNAFDRGALMLRVEGNPENLHELLTTVAQRWGVQIRGVKSGLAEEGPDLGGRHFPRLIEPRVGVWTGPGISSSQYGAIWHLLDEVVQLRFSAIDLASAGYVDLRRYNVLIFPPGRYQSWGGSTASRIKEWIDAGGTAIGIGSGAEFLASKDRGWTQSRLRREALDKFPPVVFGPAAASVIRAGEFYATGMRAPEPADEDAKQPTPVSSDPHDVAPILGPGAKPFAEGHPQGRTVTALPLELSDWLKPTLPPGQSKADDVLLRRADSRLRSFSPRGAHLAVELDAEQWMSWGLPSTMPVHVNARDTLVAMPPVDVPVRFAELDDLHLGGLLWPEAAGRLAQTAYATREGVGAGQVILFLNDPEFRGWTVGSRRILTNAILYGPGLGSSWSTPW